MHQRIEIIGDLGRDPEMRYTPKGQAVTNFSVATSHTYIKNDERITETTWFRIQTWGKQAEACNQYLQKGSRVFVEGRLVVDPQTGNPKVFEKKDKTWDATLEIKASLVRFLDKKGESRGEARTEEEDLPDYMQD